MSLTERKRSEFRRKRRRASSSSVWLRPTLVVGLQQVLRWVSSWVFCFSIVVFLGVCSWLFDMWVSSRRENFLICAKCMRTLKGLKVSAWFEKNMKQPQKLCRALIVIGVNCVLRVLFNYRVFMVYWTIVLGFKFVT